jgi:hypothetical protein
LGVAFKQGLQEFLIHLGALGDWESQTFKEDSDEFFEALMFHLGPK